MAGADHHWRDKRWIWALAVALAHLVLLEWALSQHGTSSKLLGMDTPTFRRTLNLSVAEAPSANVNTLKADTEGPAPEPTVGQRVQARQVVAAGIHGTGADSRHAAPVRQTETPPKRPAKPRPTDGADADQAPDAETAATPSKATGLISSAPLPESNAHTDGPPSDSSGSSPQPAPSATSGRSSAMPDEAERVSAPDSPSSTQSTSNPTTPTTARFEAPSAHWQSWPDSTRLLYRLKGHFRGELHGSAHVEWRRQAERYQAQVAVDVALLVHMTFTSQGRIQAHSLWPEVYEEERRGKRRSSRFGDQWVTLDNGNQLPRPAGLQDTASQFVQLAQDFRSGRLAPANGQTVAVTLGRPGGIDTWVYDLDPYATVDTALGKVPAIHLKPRPLAQARGTVSAEMWFSPQLQHLPVRIRLNLNPETWLDLILERVLQAD